MTLHVGVFDSGVGGLSVLRALHAEMPSARFTYFADSLHAPYGERDAQHVAQRSARIADALIRLGAHALVVACNTATALAIDHLRAERPGLPIVGVEPGIKPAVALTRTRRVAVLATPATLRSPRLQRLVAAHSADCELVLQPCPGLAGRIEQGHLDRPDLGEMIRGWCVPLRERGVDVVVLGCTHYPFVRNQIAEALGPAVMLLDTAEAVARQTRRRCAALGAEAGNAGDVALLTHADPAALVRLAQEGLPFAWRIAPAPTELL